MACRIAVAVTLLPMVAGVCSARAQDSAKADDHVAQAMRFQGGAERAAVPALALEYLRKAQAEYDQAISLDVRNYRARLGLARCLQQLSRRAVTPAEHASLVRAACEQYARTARLPESDWRLYQAWAKCLIIDGYEKETDPARRAEAVRAARAVLENALPLATFSGDRNALEADLGSCLVWLAPFEPAGERQALYERAVTCFSAVPSLDRLGNATETYCLWGTAYLELGKVSGSRVHLHLAVDRLKTSLEKNPQQTEARYNLACSYALLADTAQAVRELRTCFEQDDSHRFLQIAADDPDLHLLRETPEFHALIAPPPAPGVPLVPPPVQNR
jgi:hypothetical protein